MDGAAGLACFWVIVGSVCALIGFNIAERRDSPGLGALVGFLFGPFGVLIACLLDGRGHCASCDEPVGSKAEVCPHCGNRQEHEKRGDTAGPNEENPKPEG